MHVLCEGWSNFPLVSMVRISCFCAVMFSKLIICTAWKVRREMKNWINLVFSAKYPVIG